MAVAAVGRVFVNLPPVFLSDSDNLSPLFRCAFDIIIRPLLKLMRLDFRLLPLTFYGSILFMNAAI